VIPTLLYPKVEETPSLKCRTHEITLGSKTLSSNLQKRSTAAQSHLVTKLTPPSFFHKAHPWVLPRYYFLARLESDPGSLKYLLSVLQYIGSLFAPDISSSDLRDHALQQLDHPNLPPNGFTVLALLLSAIAIHAEDDFERGRAILDRAIYMALEIRMNSRTFANMERDPVLAESWRRTFWGLYITDSLFAGIRQAPSFL
jgi:hypothetical protein